MRKIFNLIVWISSISILLLSCSKDETENDKKPNDDDNNMVTVSLGLTGDILEVEETPLSKAVETADIYGVQIYSSPKDEDNYQPYGGGRFIDKSKMQVKLFKDRKYKFEITVFPNGEYRKEENGRISACTGIRIPMGADGDDIADSIRYFNYEIGQLSGSNVHATVRDLYTSYEADLNRNRIDRYYGKLTDYIPTENGSVNVDMKRVVAGLTFIVKGLPDNAYQQNVSLQINIEEAPPLYICSNETYNSFICLMGERISNGAYEHQSYYTDKWFENPIDEVPFTFTWTNGERTESFKQTVTLKRKMNYTFKIDVPEIFLVNNGITITEEDKTWDDDVMVDNIYFGDLAIENEEDLRAFKEANYTKVTGNLIFKYWNKDICTGSNTLCSVRGNLKFIASTFENGFTFVDGLSFSKLSEIGGSFEFISEEDRQFYEMYDFTGFSNLKAIGSDFRIKSYVASFSNLESFNGLENLKKIGGDFELYGYSCDYIYNHLNPNFSGFVAKVEGNIRLTGLPLKDYCDLKTVLQNHTGQFIVSGNAYNPTKEQILAGECSIQ